MATRPAVPLFFAALLCVALSWALIPSNSYGYYVLLRWIVCVVAAYAAVHYAKPEDRGWRIAYSVTAIAYNPIAPLKLDRTAWSAINVATLILIVASTMKDTRPAWARRQLAKPGPTTQTDFVEFYLTPKVVENIRLASFGTVARKAGSDWLFRCDESIARYIADQVRLIHDHSHDMPLRMECDAGLGAINRAIAERKS